MGFIEFNINWDILIAISMLAHGDHLHNEFTKLAKRSR